MPAEILSRIPLPSLRVYTSISLLLVAGCVYYSFNVTSDPSWKQNVNITLHYPPVSLDNGLPPPPSTGEGAALDGLSVEHQLIVREDVEKVLAGPEYYDGDFRSVMDQLQDMMSFMGQEAICIWVSPKI